MKKTFLILVAFLLLAGAFQTIAQTPHELPDQGASLPQVTNTVDADEDGLDDAIEQQLIDRFRPYYFFDHANDKWAASVLWFVRRSELYYRAPAGRVLVYSREQLSANPELVLQALVSGESSDGAISPKPSKYFIDPRSSEDANGEGPCADVGCYAHVMPIILPIQPKRNNYPDVDNDPNPHPAILIQFYQFFPYNDSQSCCGGDHEGDWVYMDIYVKPEAPYSLIGVVYHHHGDGKCPPKPVVKSLSRPPANLPLNCGAPDNSVAPVCFLEEDNHEWWPSPGDNECTFEFCVPVIGFPCIEVQNDRHDGNGVRYRVRNVINLGERFAPSDNLEARVAMLFNGKWGNDDDGDKFGGEAPAGITDGGEHFFPVPKLVVAHVKSGAEVWKDLGAGSTYHPCATVTQAVDSLRSNGTIRLNAGSYPGPLQIGGPGVNLRLEAIGGSAVLGR